MKRILFLLFMVINLSAFSQSLPLINVGASENDHSGDKLRDACIKLNQAITELNRLGVMSDNTKASERNVLVDIDANVKHISTIEYIPTIFSAAGDTSNYPIPGKIGNIYIDTSAGDIYVSVKAIRHNGWKKVN